MAISAPTPSCQARVGSEKKAHGAATSVHTRARTKEATTMTDTTSHRCGSFSSRRLRKMISGQKR